MRMDVFVRLILECAKMSKVFPRDETTLHAASSVHSPVCQSVFGQLVFWPSRRDGAVYTSVCLGLRCLIFSALYRCPPITRCDAGFYAPQALTKRMVQISGNLAWILLWAKLED